MLKWSTTTFTSSDNDTATATAAATTTTTTNLNLNSEEKTEFWNHCVSLPISPFSHDLHRLFLQFTKVQFIDILLQAFNLKASGFNQVASNTLAFRQQTQTSRTTTQCVQKSLKEERRDVWNPKMAIARQRKESLKLSNTHASKCGSSTPKWKFPEREQTSKQMQRKHDAAPRNTTQCLSAPHIQR